MEIGKYGGYKIVTDTNMVTRVTKQVNRGFWERLFSTTPFKATKTVVVYIPKKGALVIGDTIIVHPSIKDELIR